MFQVPTLRDGSSVILNKVNHGKRELSVLLYWSVEQKFFSCLDKQSTNIATSPVSLMPFLFVVEISEFSKHFLYLVCPVVWEPHSIFFLKYIL